MSEDRAVGTKPHAWFQVAPDAVLGALGSTAQGLDGAEAKLRLERFGPNVVQGGRGRAWTKILLAQLSGILNLILFAAIGFSILLGDFVDAGVILAIVVLNTALGFHQEYQAERAMAALQRLAAPTVRVRRDGEIVERPAVELVPGDVVLLEAGNTVPADGRLLVSASLQIQEASLTGEADAIEKDATLVLAGEHSLGDRRNLVFSSTNVTAGHGEAVVTETGATSEIGKIAGMLAGVEEEPTPLQRRLGQLGRGLAAGGVALAGVMFVSGLLRGEPWHRLVLGAVSLAVAVIPEAMTAAVTIALAGGAQRMLARKALIRRLPAVETLGSVDVVCSDKTGTLTQNLMTVSLLAVAGTRVRLVQRPGKAQFDLEPVDGKPLTRGAQPALDRLLMAGALCSDATLKENPSEPGAFEAMGDPTEGALLVAAAKVGILPRELNAMLPRVAEAPFDSVRKRMTTVHRLPEASDAPPAGLESMWDRAVPGFESSGFVAITKGAFDGMLKIVATARVDGKVVPFDETLRKRVVEAHDELAADGMRVLAFAGRPLDAIPEDLSPEGLEREMTLMGLVGMIDPPRPEARDAVERCRSAGIRPVMITGDHPLTARSIADAVGIATEEGVITGLELDKLDEAALRRSLDGASVFARVTPEHKLRIVRAYRAEGHVVAMTGDGVNDAPALKQADIGVAMGISGTDVAKESARMVLLDDNFATIVAAVEEGRVVYDNIRRFVRYLLTSNTAEVIIILLAPLFGMPTPLLPLQILWVNLVTDGLPALALGSEPAEPDVMKRAPQKKNEGFFHGGMLPFVLLISAVMGATGLGLGTLAYRASDPHWQTLILTTIVFASLALAVAVRSDTRPVWSVSLWSNRRMLLAVVVTIALHLGAIYVPFAQRALDTTALPPRDLGLTVVAALVVLVAVELWKWGMRRKAASLKG
jgi:Ca2+-transporting ATPase